MNKTIFYGTALLAPFLSWFFFAPFTGGFSAEQKSRYGPWAVVAGASEGLGAEWARQLAKQGLNVLLVARREKQLLEVAESIAGVEVDTYTADLLELNAGDIFEHIQKRGRRKIGLVVFNAMYTAQGGFLDEGQTVDRLKRVVNLNNGAMLEFIHPLMRAMKQNNGGGVVLMSSLGGETGAGNVATYSASKKFVTILSRALFWEFRNHAKINIDVLACIAGATTTPNYLESRASTAESFMEQTPEAVVRECISALGKTSSVATGFFNKLGKFVVNKLLGDDFGTSLASETAKHQLDFSKENSRHK